MSIFQRDDMPKLQLMELPNSLLSRLAAHLRYDSVTRLCHDYYLDFAAICRGEPGAIEAVAELVGVEPVDLSHGPLVADGLAKIDGELFSPAQLDRHELWYCPACAVEQVDASPHLSADAAIAVARDTIVSAIGGCFRHGIAFLFAGRALWARHDTAMVMAAVADKARAALAGQPEPWSPSSIDRYVRGRMESDAPPVELLDQLPMHRALTLCAQFGNWAANGGEVELRSLDRHALNRLMTIGLDVLAGGTDEIGNTFERQFQARSSTSPIAASALMGPLRDTLIRVSRDPAHAPVCDAVVEAAISRIPSFNGPTMLGRQVGQRAWQSPGRVMAEFGLGQRTVRVFSKMAGDLREEVGDWIDVPKFRKWWEHDGGLVLQKDAGLPYGASLKWTGSLVSRGFLTPVTSTTASERGVSYLRRGEYQRFMDALLQNAEACATMPGGASALSYVVTNIVKSDRVVEAFRVVLNNKVWVGRLEGADAFHSIIVDVDEIRRALVLEEEASSSDPEDWLLAAEFAKECGIGSEALHALTGQVIKSELRVQPASGLKRKVYARSEADRFKERFVTLHRLAPMLGWRGRDVIAKLAERNVHPKELSTDKITIFARDDLRGILPD